VHATDATGTRRKVAVGGGVYPGDMLETAEGGQAVVFFRDGGRVALGATTRMRVDNFVYDPASASDGRFLASILQGTVRSETGEIARANPRNVIFTSSLATVSAPVGGVDMQCTGACVSDASGPSGGLTVVARTGGANVTAARSPQAHVLQPGQAIFIGAQGAQAVTTPPQFADAPLPAQVAAPAGLFGNTDVSESEEGVYVLVRDGHIELRGAREVVHLGRGEAGLARLDGTTARPVTVPRFLQFDRTPLPTSTRPIVTSMLQTSAMGGSAAGGLCR